MHNTFIESLLVLCLLALSHMTNAFYVPGVAPDEFKKGKTVML
jgi:hypothetical protein